MFGKTEKPSYNENSLKLLRRLIKMHDIAHVEFDNNPKHFASMLLDLDLEKGYLLLDEFFPIEGHELAMEGKKFKVMMHDRGVPVLFKSKVDSYIKDDHDIHTYQVLIPKNIRHIQRRKAFRARVDLVEDKQAFAAWEDFLQGEGSDEIDKDFKVLLYDLSFLGVKLYIENQDLSNFFKVSDVVENFEFKAGDVPIKCKLLLKRVFYDEIKKKTFISGMFEELEKQAVPALAEYIGKLERELIKLEAKRNSDREERESPEDSSANKQDDNKK